MNYVWFLIWCKQGKQAAIDTLEISQHQMLLHQGKTNRQFRLPAEPLLHNRKRGRASHSNHGNPVFFLVLLATAAVLTVDGVIVQFNSIQFFIIYVPSQQPKYQLQTQHSLDTTIIITIMRRI
jgi:hypothetical protein